MDVRPLSFFKLSFAALMLVYSAGRCSDDVSGNHKLGVFYSFEHRVPSLVFDAFVRYFPFFTHQDLYWEFHAPLMLLCAAGMAVGYGSWSRVSAFLFAVLKMALTLQTQHTYNNHEYLYALIAVALGLVDCHDMHFSFVGKVVMESLPQLKSKRSSAHLIPAWISLAMLTAGCGYMMLQNTIYGIAGNVATVGMCIFIWPAIILLLGQPETQIHSSTITTPEWQATFIRALIASVYIYAGMAKLSSDWLSGATVRELVKLWTGPTAPTMLKDMVLRGVGRNGMNTLLTWGGVLLDLTSPLGLNFGSLGVKVGCTACLVGFHISNHYLFIIETFPWVMVSALAVHFGPSWIEYAASLLTLTLSPIWTLLYLRHPMQEAHETILYCLKNLRVVAVLGLLLLLLLVPLPCALHSLGEDGSLTWGSQCSYWSWRMMTRSTRVLSVGLSMTNDSNTSSSSSSSSRGGGQTGQQVWLREMGLLGVWQEAAPYEDRFAAVLARHEPKAAHKYADVWLEVNGPPFQRYFDPAVDLNGPLGGLNPPRPYWQSLLQGPAPLANWTLPRIIAIRTNAWKAEFARLERLVASTAGGESVEVAFLADLPDGPSLHLSSSLGSIAASIDCSKAHVFEVQLLSGQASILNVETDVAIEKGACVRFQGDLLLRAEGTEPAVWMVVMAASERDEINHHDAGCAAVSHKLLRANSHIANSPMPAPRTLHVTDRGPGPNPFRFCVAL